MGAPTGQRGYNWAMRYFLGVIAFILAVLFSVAIHELGHMIPAKKFGALVPRYMVGFGPTLWSKTKGETEYGIKAILLGGYVTILGMFAPAKPETVVGRLEGKKITYRQYQELDEQVKSQVKLTYAQEAREASQEELPPGKEDRAFYRLSVPRKIVVMSGGIFTNILLCIVLVAITVAGFGFRAASTTLEKVPKCLGSEATCEYGPAYQAGLEAGDKIVSWGGKPTPKWEDVRQAVQESTGDPVTVVVERNHETKEFTLTPKKLAGGNYVAGIVAKEYRQRGGVKEIADNVWLMFSGTVAAIVKLPVSLYELTVNMFNSTPRDPNGAVSIVGVGMLAGQIASAQGGSITWADRFAAFFSLMAALNMALFVFNIIPLLPLDGGHIAGAMWEGIRRQFAKWRGKPDPGYVDVARATPLTIGVWVTLILMMVILIAADVLKPVSF